MFSGIFVSGISTFLPKYLESQFSLTSAAAGIYFGEITTFLVFLGGITLQVSRSLERLTHDQFTVFNAFEL